jgi:peroxiredoxin Q/BCP
MLQENTKAPEFTAKALVNNQEKEISLKDFKGKKVVLYFYPKDLTPGCTMQAENLRDHFKDFQDKNIVIIGVSPDPIEKHQKFVEKKELPFILVSDEDKILCNTYQVWGEKKFMGRTYNGVHRTTFLIDEQGIITHIISKPKVKQHAQEIFELLEK